MVGVRFDLGLVLDFRTGPNVADMTADVDICSWVTGTVTATTSGRQSSTAQAAVEMNKRVSRRSVINRPLFTFVRMAVAFLVPVRP